MASWRILQNDSTQQIILKRVQLCESFWCHFRGLMLIKHLPADNGLLFVTGRESKAQTTIHMFFMRFPIGVVWLDSERRVVDAQLAKPWRPAYAPCAPAQYFLEANVSILDRVKVGDVLRFDEPSNP